VKVLFDTNVVLDVLLAREPFVRPATLLLCMVDRGEIRGLLGATTLTTLHYLASKGIGRERAREQVRRLLDLFDVAPVDREVLHQALEVDFPDFEDAVLHEAARAVGAEAIVTRNGNDFRQATLPVYTPEELLRALQAKRGLS